MLVFSGLRLSLYDRQNNNDRSRIALPINVYEVINGTCCSGTTTVRPTETRTYYCYCVGCVIFWLCAD